MSDAGTSIARPDAQQQEQGHGPDAPSFMLPQWAFDLMRLVGRPMFRLLWGLRFSGLEHIPAHGNFIIAANHQTYIDPFWLSLPVRRPLRYLAWAESFNWPIVGPVMRWLGAWPLQLEGSDPRAIRRSLKWLRSGGVLVIFPEGGRCYADGRMHRFKAGAARLALEAGVPILPVTIRGGERVWPRGWRCPHLTERVEIIYHAPRLLRPLPGEDVRQCARREIETLAQIIGAAL